MRTAPRTHPTPQGGPRLLVIGGGGAHGIKYVQPALRHLGPATRADCLEKRPARPGEVETRGQGAA